jgi:hypothetical protein
MEKQSQVLIGQEWLDYLKARDFLKLSCSFDGQTKLYSGVTFKYIPIYKLGDYYFCMKIRRGYRNISALKRLITTRQIGL